MGERESPLGERGTDPCERIAGRRTRHRDILVLCYAVTPGRRYKELPQHVRVYAPPEPQSEFGLLTYKESMSG